MGLVFAVRSWPAGRAVPGRIALEPRPWRAYSPPMDDIPTPAIAPAGWLEALARSEAERAAGLSVPGEVVHQRIRDAIARIEARRATGLRHGTAAGVD